MASKDLKGKTVEYVKVKFQTTYVTHDSDVCLAVIGSIPDLGRWHVGQCLLAREDPKGSGKWEASISLFATTLFLWKFAIVSSDKTRVLRWEETQNRDTTIGCTCEFVKIEAPWGVTATIRPLYIQEEGHPSLNFATFKRNYGKVYKTETGNYPGEEDRWRLFEKNVRYVVAHNRRYNLGETSFHVGVNGLSDLTDGELKEIYGVNLSKGRSAAGNFQSKPGAALPPMLDWRKNGYVTPVKDQVPVGTGAVFSAIWSLEGQILKVTQKLVSHISQELVDAHIEFGNANMVFDCMIQRGGMIKLKDFYNIESGSEKQLQEAVATIGPISVVIDASPSAFLLYKGGIYDEPSASSVNLNHAVLCVGYGEENGKEYWIVKNSWGEKWGEAGYIRMARHKGNQSGIATMASYPQLGFLTETIL